MTLDRYILQIKRKELGFITLMNIQQKENEKLRKEINCDNDD